MSYGDEMGDRARVIRLVPRILERECMADAGSARQCPQCGETTAEPGERCEDCRLAQGPVSAAFVQATIADGIARLDRISRGHVPSPMVLPLQRALSAIRQAYDAAEPLIHSLQVGIVHEEEGEFWALPHPFDSAPRLGPFGKRRHAERALVEHALAHGPWDSEPEGE